MRGGFAHPSARLKACPFKAAIQNPNAIALDCMEQFVSEL